MITYVAGLTAWLVLATLLVPIAAWDLKSQRIPNTLNFALFGCGLAAAALTQEPGLTSATVGAALGFGLPLAVAEAYRRIRGVDGLGFGDVKFLAAAGTWTGWQGIGPTICLAAVLALMVLAVRKIAGEHFERNQAHPFGPYLCIALLVVRGSQLDS